MILFVACPRITPDNPDTFFAMNNLTIILASEGKYKESTKPVHAGTRWQEAFSGQESRGANFALVRPRGPPSNAGPPNAGTGLFADLINHATRIRKNCPPTIVSNRCATIPSTRHFLLAFGSVPERNMSKTAHSCRSGVRTGMTFSDPCAQRNDRPLMNRQTRLQLLSAEPACPPVSVPCIILKSL